jgi:sterol desaturase/sphingolipid hydroxylase (fatty acid hydroxylase superfamily)
MSAIRYGLYPTLLLGTLVTSYFAMQRGWDLAAVFAWMAGVRLLILGGAEYHFPARPQWAMTWLSFKRDMKYIAANGALLLALRTGGAWLTIDLSRFNTGLVSNTSWWLEFLALLLVFELFQYGFHRWSHEGQGRIGQWLWKLHVAHHLPDKVYLLMHPVGHPLNFLISLALIQLPLVVLGARAESIFLFNALMGLQGLFSHFNVDIHAGPLNYLLVGTEGHRLHHSADLREAKNFGVLTPCWDLVFGTFVLRPGSLPARLGVVDPARYPASADIGKVLSLPFKH